MTSRGNHVDQLISASLSGDLTDAERAELDAHLVRCESCRATLAAFTAERRILSGLPVADPPPDLPARIRAGIESGRFGKPWWRRSSGVLALGASLATVAAAVLAVVIFGNLDFSPVGQQSNSPAASGSVAPGPSAVETSPATERPTPVPAFALGPGELGYLSVTGAPLEALKLSFINDATGASIDAGTVSGPAIAASLSPDGQWLAYITQKGETGANEVWALHLTDGKTVPLGCSEDASFTDRLAWAPDGTYLAYTLIKIDLGSGSGCPANDGALGTADAWVFDVANDERFRLTRSGNAYSSSFMSGSGPATLLLSFAAESPWTEAVPLGGDPTNIDRIEGVFLPLVSPDGNRAIFWNGRMTANGGSWHFSLGGLPQVSRDFRSAGPASAWVGTALFTDLVAVGGEGFASGAFRWGPDSDLIAFWDGAWNGAPQSADGIYPSQQDVYVGRVSESLLSQASLLDRIDAPETAWWVDVTFASDGSAVAATVGYPSAGIGDPPSANLEILSLEGGTTRTIGSGGDPAGWDGPAVFGR
jgi:putative zinc finger protein/WD40 repeat protein